MTPKRARLSGMFLLAAAATAGCGSSQHASGQVQPGGGTGGSHLDAGAIDADAAASGGGGIAPVDGKAGNGGGGGIGIAPGGGGAAGAGSGGAASVGVGGSPGSGGNLPPGAGGAGGHAPPGDPGQALLLPPSCKPVTQMATEDGCMLDVYCDSFPYVTSCQRLDSGRWRCSSDPRHTDRIYEIDGAAGIQACAITTWLSTEDQLTLGADSCQPVLESEGTNSCTTELFCGTTVVADFAPDAHVMLPRYGTVECEPSSFPDAISCTFRVNDKSTSSDLGVFSDTASCRSLAEFCMKTTAPGFDEPRTCLLAQATSTADGCQRSELCTSPLPATESPGFPSVESRYATCEPATGGGATCYCSVAQSYFSFHVASAPDDANCAATITSCEPTADIQPTDAATCQPTSHTESSDTCDADLSCSEPATVDGRDVVADGRLLVSCARAQRGQPWSCSCASDQLTATFSLASATATPAQACGQAPQECVKHIPVHLGPYGPFKGPPDPSVARASAGESSPLRGPRP